MWGIIKKIGIGILISLLLLIGWGVYRGEKQEKTKDITENWGDIHSDFKNNPELITEWQEKGFDYRQAKAWCLVGLKPELSELAYFLTQAKGVNASWFLDNYSQNKDQIITEYLQWKALKERMRDIEKQKEFNQKTESEKDWGEIHPSFKSNPELVEEWKKHNLDYEDAKEWIPAGIKPWESDFVNWLLFEDNPEDNPISSAWIAENDRKSQMWEKWIKFRLDCVSKTKKISSIQASLRKDCQRQIWAGEKDCAEVLDFTEAREYEQFLKKKGENWEHYELWWAYLTKWLELENIGNKENNQKNKNEEETTKITELKEKIKNFCQYEINLLKKYHNFQERPEVSYNSEELEKTKEFNTYQEWMTFGYFFIKGIGADDSIVTYQEGENEFLTYLREWQKIEREAKK